jgi:hypothetical protein
MFAPTSDASTPVEVMRRDAHLHAARIAAIARERHGAAPALDRGAQRQITARRLANHEGSVSDR